MLKYSELSVAIENGVSQSGKWLACRLTSCRPNWMIHERIHDSYTSELVR